MVYTQGRSVVVAGHQLIVETDVGPGDGTRPESKCRHVLPKPRWASALMYQQVPRILELVLQRVQRNVQVLWHRRSH